MKEFVTKILLLVSLSAVSISGESQQVYTLGTELQFKVSGTSTIHDWEMVSSLATGEANLNISSDGIININSLYVRIPVKSLKSGKSQMDANANKALKAEKFPEIKFALTDVKIISGNTIVANGNLSIAGTSRSVLIEARYKLEGESVLFSGIKSIKFSEFNIDPPTAVFGTIRTGDDLQLSFKVIFKSTTKITKS